MAEDQSLRMKYQIEIERRILALERQHASLEREIKTFKVIVNLTIGYGIGVTVAIWLFGWNYGLFGIAVAVFVGPLVAWSFNWLDDWPNRISARTKAYLAER